MSIFVSHVELLAGTLGAVGSYAILTAVGVKNRLKIFGVTMLIAILIFFFGDAIANTLLNAFKP